MIWSGGLHLHCTAFDLRILVHGVQYSNLISAALVPEEVLSARCSLTDAAEGIGQEVGVQGPRRAAFALALASPSEENSIYTRYLWVCECIPSE